MSDAFRTRLEGPDGPVARPKRHQRPQVTWPRVAGFLAARSQAVPCPAIGSLTAAGAFIALFGAAAMPALADDQRQPAIFLPAAAAVRAEVFLISDEDGWNDREAALAARLRDAGSIVVGIDYPTYVKAIDRDRDDCVYLVSGIEDLSQTIQRKLGNPDLQLPIVAGFGAGGTLALAIAAQTPDATIERTVAIDPTDRLPLTATLCTPAEKELTPSGTIYALTPGSLPDPLQIVFTPEASDVGRAHGEKLRRIWPTIDIKDTDEAPFDAAFRALKPILSTEVEAPLQGLPLAILDAVPTRNIMAVVYSGDGGWRDLDKVVGQNLQKQGVPVVGVDSLQYFWKTRTVEETAADLQAILDVYRKKWHVDGVYLVGYSFGADILPSTYLALDPAHQKMVKRISLMALSNFADYQVSVTGWLGLSSGGRPMGPDLAKLPAALVQCYYGKDETDTACTLLKGTGADVVATEGGHHFDGDYAAIAAKILG